MTPQKDEVFRRLYQKYYGRLVRFFLVQMRVSQDEAEELAQDTFFRIIEALDDYRGNAEWAYLETVARNVAYNRIRSHNTSKRRTETVEIDDVDAIAIVNGIAASDDPHVNYSEKELASQRTRQLAIAIKALPEGARECMSLWLNEFSYGEIADILKITTDSVKSRLRDAKKLLRASLAHQHISGRAGEQTKD